MHRGIEQVETLAVLFDGGGEPLRREEQNKLPLAGTERRGLDPGQALCARRDLAKQKAITRSSCPVAARSTNAE
jgi:hypothetical protein